jgi:hypothetical protein
MLVNYHWVRPVFWWLLVPCLTAMQTPRDHPFHPEIPRIWNEPEFHKMELPVVVPQYSPQPVPPAYYDRIPVRTIYKSYPIYAPGHMPSGYLEKLKTLEPEKAVDTAKLQTQDDWLRAGELVFQAPTSYEVPGMALTDVLDPAWYARLHVRTTQDGVLPYLRYVVRQKGKVEVGSLSCATCHTRVLEDGTAIQAGPGNFPLDRVNALNASRFPVERSRHFFLALFSVPWLPERQRQFASYTAEELTAIYEAIQPGVLARTWSSAHSPPAVPDLHGVRERRYFDKSGLHQHRDIADLMRYAGLAEGLEFFSNFNGFIPFGGEHFDTLPPPESLARFSEPQLYALALWLESLEPLRNPRPPAPDLVAAGQRAFQREGCASCHTPPLYTNNKLTPAQGFTIPEEHKTRYDILPVVVGTDPRLTMETRRGTGYYKVPSLRGVWYRGPFEHNGSVATLEDWFDPQRLRDNYVPTGFRGYGRRTRAVLGHPFGLRLLAEEKTALIAFLKTL